MKDLRDLSIEELASRIEDATPSQIRQLSALLYGHACELMDPPKLWVLVICHTVIRNEFFVSNKSISPGIVAACINERLRTRMGDEHYDISVPERRAELLKVLSAYPIRIFNRRYLSTEIDGKWHFDLQTLTHISKDDYARATEIGWHSDQIVRQFLEKVDFLDTLVKKTDDPSPKSVSTAT